MLDQDVHVSHFVPGRLRLKSYELRRNRALADEINRTLEQVTGVRQVRINTLTGSLLVEYDPAVMDSPQHTQALFGVLAGKFPAAFAAGRIELALSVLRKRPELRERMATALRSVPGVQSVSVTDDGEIGVDYDPERLTMSGLLEGLLRAG